MDDADAALNDLRQQMSDSLNAGFLEHIKMATDVETAALDTKDANEGAAECVDAAAAEAIDLVLERSSGAVAEALKVAYDDTTEIIRCGRSDDECLNGVMAKIQEQSDGLADMIKAAMEKDRQDVDEKIAAIKACAE